jgi:lipoprotein-releasing system permease protein
MIFIAIRYLIEHPRQTILTLLGVFLGTTAYVGVSGFFKGFQGYLVEQLVNNSAQVHIQARQDYLNEHDLDTSFFPSGVDHTFWATAPSGIQGFTGVQNPSAWYERLDADPRVEAYSPLLTTAALLTLGKISVSTNLTGCNPNSQSRVTSLSQYMTIGNFSDLASGGNKLVIGKELSKKLGATVNQTVLVSIGPHSPTPFKIVGIYQTGGRGSDLQAYAALEYVQNLNQTPNRVNEIAVRLKDYTLASQMASQWSKIAPERTESWDQQNANILSVFKIQNALRFSMILTVLVVAGFGIYNVLNITVNQKRQDIAILRSIGFDTYDIITLFFSQGMILGVIGAFFGLIMGYILCRYLQTIPFADPTSVGGPKTTLHISLDIAIYIQAAAVALLSASLASILPARSAGKLTPIDIIRSGG